MWKKKTRGGGTEWPHEALSEGGMSGLSSMADRSKQHKGLELVIETNCVEQGFLDFVCL